MDIDELRTVQTKERQKDSLQHLRDSFYEDVAAYIEERKSRRQEAADAASDPFSDPEVSQLTDEIETAEDVVEAVYERRVGKVVKLASFAAADMPVDEEGLTIQERDLFEDLVGRIQENKDRVLDILAGEGDAGAAANPTAAGPAGAAPGSEPPSVAEASDTSSDPNAERAPESPPMGEEAESGFEPSETPDRTEPAVGTGSAESLDTDNADAVADSSSEPMGDNAPEPATDADGPAPPPEAPPDEPPEEFAESESAAAPGGPEPPAAEPENDARGRPDGGSTEARTTVRITADVGQVLGMDDREYDLANEDVVSLPEENADALLQQEAAEEL